MHGRVTPNAEAVRMYDQAVAGAPEDAALRGNRAAAHLALGLYLEAASDARAAVGIDAAYAKGHYRQGRLCAPPHRVVLRLGKWLRACTAAVLTQCCSGTQPEAVSIFRSAAMQGFCGLQQSMDDCSSLPCCPMFIMDRSYHTVVFM